jgi:hypothetical protein
MKVINDAAWKSSKVEAVPYPHCIIPNAIDEAFYTELELEIQKTPDEKFEQHITGYRYAALPHVEFVRFLYSRDFIARLTMMFGRAVRPSKAYPWPQTYIFPRDARGLPPHTDGEDPRDLALILYIAPDWNLDSGGELNLLGKLSDGKFSVARSISPKPNTLACIELNAAAWHSVSMTRLGWQRRTVIADYDYV